MLSQETLLIEEDIHSFKELMLKLGLQQMKVTDTLLSMLHADFVKTQLMKKQKVFVDLYVLTGQDLASRDIGSPSDPYLKVKLGN